jgi:hypothetical protein
VDSSPWIIQEKEVLKGTALHGERMIVFSLNTKETRGGKTVFSITE